MKLLIGQLSIIVLALIVSCLCYLTYKDSSFVYTVLMAIWLIILIALGFWTRTNPKKAFLLTLIFYVSTVMIKDALFGGEYLLTFLFHLYFVFSMFIGMKGKIAEYKRLSDS